MMRLEDQFCPVGVVVVVRDTTGVLLDGVVERVWSYYPLATEVRAVLETLRLALVRDSRLLVCSMDAEVLFLALTEPSFLPSSDTVAILATIIILHSQLPSLSFELVHRQGNRFTDMVVNLYLKNVRLVVTLPELAHLL